MILTIAALALRCRFRREWAVCIQCLSSPRHYAAPRGSRTSMTRLRTCTSASCVPSRRKGGGLGAPHSKRSNALPGMLFSWSHSPEEMLPPCRAVRLAVDAGVHIANLAFGGQISVEGRRRCSKYCRRVSGVSVSTWRDDRRARRRSGAVQGEAAGQQARTFVSGRVCGGVWHSECVE